MPGKLSHAEKLALYDALVASNPEIQRKGKSMPYTSLNGNMFTFLSKEGQVGLRLSKPDRENFLQTFNTELVVTYGTVMKEYVHVPDQVLQDFDTLKSYFDMSYAYAQTLRPKPTKKQKKG